MRKILVPFDGSDSAIRALRHAISVAKENPALQIELLNVVDPMPLRAHASMTNQEISRLQENEAEQTLHPARKLLDSAGVAYQAHSRVGSPANEIAEHVRETGCEAIIMGTRGLGPVASLMIGSVAMRVAHLTDVPVTLIK